MANKSNPRRANGHRRDTLRKRVAARGEPCAWCGQPIDYTLPPGTPWSYELDEKVEVWQGGNPLDLHNLQPVHKRCNIEKHKAMRAAAMRRKVQPIKPPKASQEY